MIKKIIASTIFLCMTIAAFLYIAGITHVELGAPFMSLLRNTNRELNDFKIAIPDIPHIVLINIVVFDYIINFINGIITILNTIVKMINVIISLIQFIVILIKNLVTFKDTLIDNSTASAISTAIA